MGSENGARLRRLSAQLTGVRKAAILLIAVGEGPAREVLRALQFADALEQLTELAEEV
jgi:flagellar motor switch protein FliG